MSSVPESSRSRVASPASTDQHQSSQTESPPRSRPTASPARDVGSQWSNLGLRRDAQSPSGRAASLSSGNALSSSFTQRYQGRSYFHQASHNPSEAVQYSSEGVRETTQELASIALSDASSFQSDTLSSRLQPLDAVASSHLGRIRSRDQDAIDSRTSMDSSQPDVIEEVSEPTTPDYVHVEGGAPAEQADLGSSVLTQLLQSTPAVTEEPAEIGGGRRRSSVRPQSRSTSIGGHTDSESQAISEGSSLLPRARLTDPRNYGSTNGDGPGKRARTNTDDLDHDTATTKLPSGIARVRHLVERTALDTMSMVPAVLMGLLLNILDGLSYGIILFPLGAEPFQDMGPAGIGIFYVSCIVSQLVFSCFSKFKGGVGSEMIEVVPFFHKMAYTIRNHVGLDEPDVVITTVIFSFALSSILTGIIFFTLGLFKIGSLVSFFPRSMLAGCIGGVGIFLFLTGIEVGSRLDGSFEFDHRTYIHLSDPHTLLLWLVPLGLSILLVGIRYFVKHPAVMPAFFVGIGVIFAIIVLAARLNVQSVRDSGWIFPKVASDVPFYDFYRYYNIYKLDWDALLKTVPTMFALSFFGVIHVPINVPALGVAVKEDDIDVNREIVAHGISNTLSGLVGSIQNYLVYVNSYLVIQTGGDSRAAGFLLAAATTGVWMAGPEMIGYIPVPVVATLIYTLGFDLIKEGLWETYGRLQLGEYLSVLTISLVMGLYDFVTGIVVGIVLTCLIYVVQSSRTDAINATYSGVIAESTVRRHLVQRRFLRKVGPQTMMIKLAGYLFFGSIVAVEERIRGLLGNETSELPIRYLILDLDHVTGIDFSAAEAFGRINRILCRRRVELILSGVSEGDETCKSLTMVGLLDVEQADAECPAPRVFKQLNEALEMCENEQLMEAQRRHKRSEEPTQAKSQEIPRILERRPTEETSLIGSPRRNLLHEAARSTFDDTISPVNEHNVETPGKWASLAQPHQLIMQTFQGVSDKDIDFWSRASPFFTRGEHAKDEILYTRGDTPEGVYLVEQGALRVEYDLDQGKFHEIIVPGTTCGELPFFGNTKRSGTVVADADSVTWCLHRKRWNELQNDPKLADLARELLEVALKLTSERMSAVTSYVLVTAS